MGELTVEDKIKKLMKRMSALIEQYYKEHEDEKSGIILRHYASYTHGISYIESIGCSAVTDCITLSKDNGGYTYIDISHNEDGRELFDTMTGGKE